MKLILTCFAVIGLLSPALLAADAPEFSRDVAPVLNKYCVGCHSADDAEAELRLDSFERILQGGEHGPSIDQANVKRSLLLARITGTEDPMPPEDEPQPSKLELATLVQWIQSGAKGPSAGSSPNWPQTPKFAASKSPKPITALAHGLFGETQTLAIGRFGQVELRNAKTNAVIKTIETPGKVNGLSISRGQLVIATGYAGKLGQAMLVDAGSDQIKKFDGHNDTLYAAKLSHDGTLLATASYDRKIKLWDVERGKQLRTLSGHNGAIYDLAFSPDGQVLASASADATIKIWNVASGERLDTLGQPLKEQNSVDISPDGNFVIAGGEDNRIRMWRLVSKTKQQINPLLFARFAHEGAVQQVRFSPDGKSVVSAAGDDMLKVWSATDLTQLHTYQTQPDSTQAVSIAGGQVTVGRMDGSLQTYALQGRTLAKVTPQQSWTKREVVVADDKSMQDATEMEPNNQPSTAKLVQLPARITGHIHRIASGGSDAPGETSETANDSDVDMFCFEARENEEWIVEVNAARNKSPLDSHIAILHADGAPVERVQLQAVRDSYFTFRGKDSNSTGDFRLHNWEEMKLNQLLYSAGEVVKLYHYPRGPDSGFNVYPNFGSRRGYFDTTPLAHALHEPCYIVQPHPPEMELPANGLPVFKLNFENDDDSQRRLGKDSRLTFVAPKAGKYIVAIRDVRSLQGADFKYELAIRSPKPSFKGKVTSKDPKVDPGTGRKFGLEVERVDGFDGPIDIEITDLPPGFSVVGPLQIEPGHDRAWATLLANEDAKTPTEAECAAVSVTASAMIGSQRIQQPLGSLGKIEVNQEAKLSVDLIPDHPPSGGQGELPVIEIRPGGTTTATIKIVRNGHEGRVGFGNENGAINAPHGVYVDNIGLNGVLIVEGQNERQFFITAEPWVRPMERVIFIEADQAGKPTSKPVILRVLPEEDGPSPSDQVSR